MKKIVVAMMVIALAFSAVAEAQNQQRKVHKQNPTHQKGKVVRKHVKARQITAKLNLTEEQKTKLKTTNENFKNQLRELNKLESITVKEQRERRQAIVKQHKQAIAAIFTAEQKQQIAQQRKATISKKDKARKLQELNLTQLQREKIKQVNQRYKKELSADKTAAQKQVKEKLALHQKKRNEEIKTILTPEQKQKFEELKKNRSDRKAVK